MLLIISSIIGFFRIIITVIIFILLIRWISGLFATQKHEYNNSSANYSQKDNETTITVNKQKSKKSNTDKGEYVDYEEVN
jgi:hypothetical protein